MSPPRLMALPRCDFESNSQMELETSFVCHGLFRHIFPSPLHNRKRSLARIDMTPSAISTENLILFSMKTVVKHRSFLLKWKLSEKRTEKFKFFLSRCRLDIFPPKMCSMFALSKYVCTLFLSVPPHIFFSVRYFASIPFRRSSIYYAPVRCARDYELIPGC